MAWFKKVDQSLFDGLTEAAGRKVEVLAFAEGDDVVLAAGREHLALRRAGEWQVWPWEEIGGGSWKSEALTFRWKTMSGDKFEAALTEPNRLPEFFRERIEASTVVQSVVSGDRGEVQVIARRGLGADPALHWYAVPSGGADLNETLTRAAVIAETDRLQAEYF